MIEFADRFFDAVHRSRAHSVVHTGAFDLTDKKVPKEEIFFFWELFKVFRFASLFSLGKFRYSRVYLR